MAEPFVFHFRRGDLGNPEQMYLADLRVACGLCKHPQLQRFYHSELLHPVRLERLEELAVSVREKAEYECPNCGEAVGPDDVISSAMTWSFADDAGLIRGFVEDVDDGTVRWQFVPGRRLDPQELPGWQPDAALPTHAALRSEDVLQAFGRVFQPKVAMRKLVAKWLDGSSDASLAAKLSEDMHFVAGSVDRDEVSADVTADWLAISLADCVPQELPTHRNPEGMPGRLDGWLPDGVDRAALTVLVDTEPAAGVIERAFDVANLKYERTDAGFEEITTPREQVYPRPLDLLAVARRAVYTGITPGDAARLTAEEIVGTLLRVW